MKRLTDWRSLLGLGIVFWSAVNVAAYFVVHRPWGSEGLPAIGRCLLDGYIAATVMALTAGLGRSILSRAGWDGSLAELHPLERVALQAALGLGVSALLILGVGLLGGVQHWLAWLALGLGVVALNKSVWEWLRELYLSVGAATQRLSGLQWLAAGFFGLVTFIHLLQALAPPIAWDSLAYHLQLPRHYLQTGRIVFYPQNLYSGFPQTAEMNYLWAMTAGSPAAAGVLGWAVGLLGLLGLEGFSRRLWGEQAAWLAPAFLLTGSSLSRALSSAYVDSWLILFGLGALIGLERYSAAGQRNWLFLAGGMAGLAAATKYTAGVLCLAWMGAIAWRNWKFVKLRDRLRTFLVDSSLFLLTAGLLCVPWLTRNFIWSGNLFYPAALSNASLDPWWQLFLPGTPEPRSFWRDLLLPLEATWYGVEKGAVAGKPPYDANIGPLLLAFLPGLGVGWRRWSPAQQRVTGLLLAAGGATWMIWAGLAHRAHELIFTRHYYALFPALAFLAVGGYLALSDLSLGAVRPGRLAAAILALALLLSAVHEVNRLAEADPLPVLLGKQSEADYLTQRLGWHFPALQATAEVPSAKLTLLLWEPRAFYCAGNCLPDATLRNWWYLRRTYGSAANITAALRQSGIDALLVHEAGAALLREQGTLYQGEDWGEFELLKENYLQPLARFGEAYTLYGWRTP